MTDENYKHPPEEEHFGDGEKSEPVDGFDVELLEMPKVDESNVIEGDSYIIDLDNLDSDTLDYLARELEFENNRRRFEKLDLNPKESLSKRNIIQDSNFIFRYALFEFFENYLAGREQHKTYSEIKAKIERARKKHELRLEDMESPLRSQIPGEENRNKFHEIAERYQLREEKLDEQLYDFAENHPNYSMIILRLKNSGDDLFQIEHEEFNFFMGSLEQRQNIDNNKDFYIEHFGLSEEKFSELYFPGYYTTTKLDALIQSYFVRLSSIIDNLHYFAADFYGIKINPHAPGNFRENIQEDVSEFNPELKEHLEGCFYYSLVGGELNGNRNAYVHRVPEFYLNSNWDQEDEGKRYRYTIEFEDGSEPQPMFNYLVSFREHVLYSTGEAIRLMLANPPQNPDK